MSALDTYIRKIHKYIDQRQKAGLSVNRFNCPLSGEELLTNIPVKFDKKANQGIILRAESYLELGSPLVASSAFVLFTNDNTLLHDGVITLIGPDIPASPGQNLPFAQVVMISGRNLKENDYEIMTQSQYLSDYLEGYMVRSGMDRMWSRISKLAVTRGFNFSVLGKALMALFRSDIPGVEKVEVLFVTSSAEDVLLLNDISRQVRKITTKMVQKKWQEKGIDIIECSQGWDCRTCQDKTVCDNIKQVIKVVKRKVSEKEAL